MPKVESDSGLAKPSGPRIFVIGTFGSEIEWQPVRRGWAATGKNFLRRLMDRLNWSLRGRWDFHYSSYDHYLASNRGDSSIRRASVQLLRESFPDGVAITEFGWNDVDSVFVARARQEADLIVVAGGGYFFRDEKGNLPDRVRVHLAAFEQLRCPVVGLGLGLNRLLMPSGTRPALNDNMKILLARYQARLALCSVRDKKIQAALGDVTGKPPALVGDPALFLHARSPPGLPVRQKEHDTWVGINLAFHGPTSTRLLQRLFPVVVDVLTRLRRQRPCRFLYFVHSASERLIPRLLAGAGIRCTVVDCCPEDMLAWYGLLDVHICEMLHSSIFAVNAGVPVVNLAYDEKNEAFFDLMGLDDVFPAATVNADEILERVNRALAEKPARQERLRARKTELRRDMDRFLSEIVALTRKGKSVSS